MPSPFKILRLLKLISFESIIPSSFVSYSAILSAVTSSVPLSISSLLLESTTRIPSFLPTHAEASANPSFSWSKYTPLSISVVDKTLSLFKSKINGSSFLQLLPSALLKSPKIGKPVYPPIQFLGFLETVLTISFATEDDDLFFNKKETTSLIAFVLI